MSKRQRGACRAWRSALVALSAALVVGVAATESEDWDGDDGDGAGRRVTAPFEVDGEVRHDWGQSNLRAWDGAVRRPRSGAQRGNWGPAPPAAAARARAVCRSALIAVALRAVWPGR